MKKILKISLFIIGFSLLLILFGNSSVHAVTSETATTVQELQVIMGATECSIIEGTTLKITSDFTWKLIHDIYIKIPELIIDFNGKEIRMENEAIFSTVWLEGKVTFKDSLSENGGIYCNSIIRVNEGAELIIENGNYTTARQEVSVGTRCLLWTFYK